MPGAQAPQIRQLMGHQSMSTSQKYVHKLDAGISDLVNRMNQSNEAAWKKAAETQIEAAVAQTLRKSKSKAAAKVGTFSDADADLTGRSTSTKPFVINLARVAKLADARDLKSRVLNGTCGFDS